MKTVYHELRTGLVRQQNVKIADHFVYWRFNLIRGKFLDLRWGQPRPALLRAMIGDIKNRYD